jgi:hypothetical protein
MREEERRQREQQRLELQQARKKDGRSAGAHQTNQRLSQVKRERINRLATEGIKNKIRFRGVAQDLPHEPHIVPLPRDILLRVQPSHEWVVPLASPQWPGGVLTVPYTVAAAVDQQNQRAQQRQQLAGADIAEEATDSSPSSLTSEEQDELLEQGIVEAGGQAPAEVGRGQDTITIRADAGDENEYEGEEEEEPGAEEERQRLMHDREAPDYHAVPRGRPSPAPLPDPSQHMAARFRDREGFLAGTYDIARRFLG